MKGVKYDNDFRIRKAREWRQAAVKNKDYADDQISHYGEEMPDDWRATMENTSTSCADRIQLIDALFPELRQ